jgi:hypothetical protein
MPRLLALLAVSIVACGSRTGLPWLAGVALGADGGDAETIPPDANDEPDAYVDAGGSPDGGSHTLGFSCGPSLTCDPATQYCYEVTDAAVATDPLPPGATYACRPFPPQCSGAAQCLPSCGTTCGCVFNVFPFGPGCYSCSEDDAGVTAAKVGCERPPPTPGAPDEH